MIHGLPMVRPIVKKKLKMKILKVDLSTGSTVSSLKMGGSDYGWPYMWVYMVNLRIYVIIIIKIMILVII